MNLREANVWAKDYVPVIGIVVFAVAAFSPLLFGAKVFFGEEQMGFYYPYSHYVQEAMRNGTSLMWNSSHYGGVVTNIDQFASIWNFLHRFLLWLLPLYVAHHTSILIGLIAGMLGAYYFGRSEQLSKAASVFFALAFFSATTFSWLQIGTLSAYTFAVTPWILVALRMSRAPGAWIAGVLLGAAGFAIGLLAGTAQVLLYTCVVFGFYALRLDYEYVHLSSLVGKFRASASLALMLIIGLLASWAQWYPSSALLDLTVRTGTFAAQNATAFFPTQLSSLILPPFFEIPFLGGGSTEGFYVGALGLMAVGIALLYARTHTVLAFGMAWLVIMCFGFHIFPFSWINEHVSPLSHMSGNLRWLLAGALPLAFVAAVGVDRLYMRPEVVSRNVRRWLSLFSLGMTLLLVSVGIAIPWIAKIFQESPGLLNSIFEYLVTGRNLSLPREHYMGVLIQALDSIGNQFTLLNPPFALGVLAWVLTSCFFIHLWRGYNKNYHSSILLASALIPVIAVGFLQWRTFVPSSAYATEPALVSLLHEHAPREPHSFRILGFLVGEGLYLQALSSNSATREELAALQRELLGHDSVMMWGIDRIDGFEPYRTLRMNKLLNTVIEHESTQYVFDGESAAARSGEMNDFVNRQAQRKVTFEEKVRDFYTRLPLLSMMNVRYVYSPYELAHPQLRYIDSVSLPEPAQNVRLHVYENTAHLPRMYISKGQRFVAESDTESFHATMGVQDFATETIIECAHCDSSEGDGALSVERYENGHVAAEVDLAQDAWVVLSESAMPGWEASVDGNKIPIFVANYLFQTIRVPAGTHRIEFRYEDVRPW